MKSIVDSITEWHEKAMGLCEQAFFAQRIGDVEEFKKFHHQAFDFELLAAMHTPIDREPTRSVLYSSAMFCAFDAGLIKETIEVAEALLSFTQYEEYIQKATELIGELKLIYVETQEKRND